MNDSPESLFAAFVAAQPARPFVTFYDDASGERSELSAKSLANWVAKTFFLLTDELGLGVGDRAFVAVSAHWIALPVLLGSWTAGLGVTRDPGAAAVAFVGPDTVDLAAGVPDVFAVAPDAAARGFEGVAPSGAVDYVAAIRPQPDAWASVHAPGGPDDAALDDRSRTEVVAQARARAEALGIAPGTRLLTTRPWASSADWIDALLVPLVVGGSLVILTNSDADGLERRLKQERAVRLS